MEVVGTMSLAHPPSSPDLELIEILIEQHDVLLRRAAERAGKKL